MVSGLPVRGYNVYMTFVSILPSYITWHYGEALRDGLRVWTNLLWFLSNFFSLSLLIRTFFAPWKRIQESRGRLSIENIAEAVVTNTIMRFVGALMRFVVICIGCLAVLATFWLGVVFLVVWLLMPLLCIGSLFYGVSFLTQ